MACNPVPEEPDYTALSDFIDDSDISVHNVDDSVISHTLSRVAANASLGDTKIAVPGCLLGCVQAYVEAGASDYIIETVKYCYKLVFIDDVPPPKDFCPNNKSALSKPTFLWE